ncbi:MAG: Rrf2 family transcriptional regulator, partial [Nitrospinae bacterium]|nr:Rrf2 family transcriptional regulator [Nitrospinota bacterium]
MQLTRAADYAIRGILYLAQQPAGHLMPLETIAARVEVPVPFLAKVFQVLT